MDTYGTTAETTGPLFAKAAEAAEKEMRDDPDGSDLDVRVVNIQGEDA